MADTRVFTQQHLEAWRRALRTERPAAMSEAELLDTPQVNSLRSEPLDAGVAVRFVTRDGATIDLLLNPIVARHLAACIVSAGREGRWMEEDTLDIIPPSRPPLNS